MQIAQAQGMSREDFERDEEQRRQQERRQRPTLDILEHAPFKDSVVLGPVRNLQAVRQVCRVVYLCRLLSSALKSCME